MTRRPEKPAKTNAPMETSVTFTLEETGRHIPLLSRVSWSRLAEKTVSAFIGPIETLVEGVGLSDYVYMILLFVTVLLIAVELLRQKARVARILLTALALIISCSMLAFFASGANSDCEELATFAPEQATFAWLEAFFSRAQIGLLVYVAASAGCGLALVFEIRRAAQNSRQSAGIEALPKE